VSLEHAWKHYVPERQFKGPPPALFDELDTLYEDFRALFDPDTLEPKEDIRGLEQKRSGIATFGLGKIYVELQSYLSRITPARTDDPQITIAWHDAPAIPPGINTQ
jgi:hypothetical protein